MQIEQNEIARHLANLSLSGGSWGLRGEKAIERLETGLAVKLPQPLLQFVNEIGNLRIDPFSIVAGGDVGGQISAVTETQNLWRNSADLRSRKAIQLMSHAGEIYVYDIETAKVFAYDSLSPSRGEETLSWPNLQEFLRWIMNEAGIIKHELQASPQFDTPSGGN